MFVGLASVAVCQIADSSSADLMYPTGRALRPFSRPAFQQQVNAGKVGNWRVLLVGHLERGHTSSDRVPLVEGDHAKAFERSMASKAAANQPQEWSSLRIQRGRVMERK